uniref:Uncharacterized protein n=1 Tax=Pseudo-nitzschia australis TaxID=44445 RepID=A0A7S4AXT3_9STRA|mmetsp:Transcript_25559/g.55994  ORF Transcript_25559/g.55994 Transcript_25559/m.55994 type:complete len:102 (-) Transcript_25559:399-704(-)
MRSAILSRTRGAIAQTQRASATATTRRGMAGGPISARYKVTKNKFVEEWNGRREITEKIWECDPKMAANLFLYVVVIPFGFYTITRGEFQSKGDRRYKDCV